MTYTLENLAADSNLIPADAKGYFRTRITTDTGTHVFAAYEDNDGVRLVQYNIDRPHEGFEAFTIGDKSDLFDFMIKDGSESAVVAIPEADGDSDEDAPVAVEVPGGPAGITARRFRLITEDYVAFEQGPQEIESIIDLLDDVAEINNPAVSAKAVEHMIKDGLLVRNGNLVDVA